MRTVVATRYVTPLREGGSLPALVEGDDDGLYVVKFRGAGQGPRALAAELLGGRLATELGLLAPEVVLVELDPRIATAEPDPEIQDLLKASEGLNAGLDFLPAALPFNPLEAPSPQLAARIVWFDAFTLNVDRTPRNPNLLRWHERLWLIDHGAAFYRHHEADSPSWDATGAAERPFPAIAEHVLLPFAGPFAEAAESLTPALSAELFSKITGELPRQWADPAPYFDFLVARLARAAQLTRELEDVRDGAR